MNGMLELFKVGASLILDKSGFDSDIREADAAGKGLSESLSKHMEKAKKVIKGLFSVGAVVAATKAIWNLAKETSAAGDRIDKQSQALGLSRKAYQEWDYILRQSGASIDDMGMAMKTMSNAILENSADTAAGLSKLGLSAAQLANMSPEEQLETLVKAFQEMPEGAEKSQLAMQLFGRNAQSLMPLLNSASGSVDELRNRAHDLGLIMSDEDVDSAVAFGDALDDLNAVWTALKQKFGAQLLPGLTKGLVTLANALGRITNSLTDAFKTGDWKGVFATITEEIGNLLPQAIDAISGMILGLFENADKIIDLGISLVNGLVDGVAKAAPTLIAKLPQILSKAWESIKSMGLKLGNVLIDAINAVLGTNIPHIDEIRWPTWDEVKEAASKAWEKIKEGALTLAGLVFGKKEDGSVDWPTWDDVVKAANDAWDKIKEGALDLAGLVFGKKEDGSVAWPTWDDVKTFATKRWNEIKAKVLDFAGLVFGKKEDGTVAWPTWDDVVAFATKRWNEIKAKALDFAGLIFGKKEDGSVNWPTWDDVVQAANDAWDAIKAGVADLGGLVFGKNSDGSVRWPKWSEMLESFDQWWNGENGIRAQITKCATWVLNLFGLPEETVTTISEMIGGWWEPLRAAAEGALTWFLADPETPDANEAGKRIRQAVEEWWGRIKDTVGSVLKLIFSIPESPSEVKTAETIRKWWNDNVVPILRNALDFVLGLFGLPQASEMVEKVKTWWNGVKEQLRFAIRLLLGLPETPSPGKTMIAIQEWWDDKVKGVSDFLKTTFGLDFPDVVQSIINWWNETVAAVGSLFIPFFTGPGNGGGSEEPPAYDTIPEGGQDANGRMIFELPGEHAKGLNYVPYDGYRAVLHRGETVLNQSQGREWRQNGGGAGIDFEALAAAVSGAVAEAVSNISLNMDGKAVGSAVAGQVSREITKSLMGRRVPAL